MVGERRKKSETVVAMICYVHSGKGCSGWQRRSSSGWCKASRSANFSIMITEFLFELWWRPRRLMTSLSVSDRNALRPTSGLIWDCVRAMLVGHSTSELIQAGRNKFPKSTSLCHLKPGSHMKLWKNALRCYSPQQHEQCVRVKSHYGRFPHLSSQNFVWCFNLFLWVLFPLLSPSPPCLWHNCKF